jgi:tetratricopeptide (TPR) repeat protein
MGPRVALLMGLLGVVLIAGAYLPLGEKGQLIMFGVGGVLVLVGYFTYLVSRFVTRVFRVGRALADTWNEAGKEKRKSQPVGPGRGREEAPDRVGQGGLMDTFIPSLREQGVQALRQGHLDQAIDFLVQAVRVDSRDAEAQAFLGMAYSQKGLHPQAIQALTTAVEREPQNAQYSHNLGAALERAGDRQHAAAAYREALQIDPQHAQARARLQALGPEVQLPTHSHTSPGEWVSSRPSTGASGQSGRLPGGDEAPAGPAGTVRCPHCGQWSKPWPSCEWCSRPLSPVRPPTPTPWAQSEGISGAQRTNGLPMRERWIGAFLLLAGTLLGYLDVYLPLEATARHAPNVSLSPKSVIVCPLFVVLGACYLILGESAISVFGTREKPSRAALVIGIGLMLAGIGLYQWLKGALEAQGYHRF